MFDVCLAPVRGSRTSVWASTATVKRDPVVLNQHHRTVAVTDLHRGDVGRRFGTDDSSAQGETLAGMNHPHRTRRRFPEVQTVPATHRNRGGVHGADESSAPQLCATTVSDVTCPPAAGLA